MDIRKLYISRNLQWATLVLLISAIVATACSKEKESSNRGFNSFVVQDIEYAANTDTSGNLQHLALDLYIPAKTDSNENFPLVVMIHGGSYWSGNKEWVNSSCEILQNSGFIVGNINYRLGWRVNGNCIGETHTLEEAAYRGMQDANAALRFLVANSVKYGIDTNWVFLAGESAGAAIALNSSFTTSCESDFYSPDLIQKLGGLHNAGNTFTGKYGIKGICNKWGAISDSNLIKAGNQIPVISFHGTNDELVPYDKGYMLNCTSAPAYGSLCIYRRLKATGGISVIYIKNGGVHQPDEFSPEFTMSRVATFFHNIMQNKATSEIYFEQ